MRRPRRRDDDALSRAAEPQSALRGVLHINVTEAVVAGAETGGLRFAQSLSTTFELARPLDRTPFTQNDRDWRGFFSVSKGF